MDHPLPIISIRKFGLTLFGGNYRITCIHCILHLAGLPGCRQLCSIFTFPAFPNPFN